jgi:hypothetical protein
MLRPFVPGFQRQPSGRACGADGDEEYEHSDQHVPLSHFANPGTIVARIG